MDLNPESLSQLGAGGVLLTIWTWMLFGYLKERKRDDPAEGRGYKILHDARVETAIQKLVENLTRQTEILESIREDQKEMAGKIDALRPCKSQLR